MHIVLVGNTGSGKTTLAKALQERLDLPLVSSGEVARELSESDPTTNLALQQGAMAPEAAMRTAVRTRIEQADLKRGGWILDGFPRSTEQLICLMQWTVALPSFIYLEVDTWVCIERLLSRKRDHDNPDAIGRRLQHFEQHTQPMLTTLSEGGVLDVIQQADFRSVDEIVAKIESRQS
jgi:adenylate kinase